MSRRIFINNMPLSEARERFRQALAEVDFGRNREAEIIPVEQARGRVTAQAVSARISSPHYHGSAMDGVAVRAEDTFEASETQPLQLQLGEQAAVVDTGDPLPEGANAVIMVEDLHFLDEVRFEIIQPAVPWQHIRMVGEDVVAAEMLVPENQMLRSFEIAALFAGGVRELAVHRQIRVAFIPTGSELVPAETDPQPGEILEFNSHLITGLAAEWGAATIRHPIVIDDRERLRAAVAGAVASADIVIVNAGSSAGREDFTAEIIAELGRVIVHGVATRPGKPVILGIIDNKPVLGLPGYPVSAALTAQLFLKPLIYEWYGQNEPEPERMTAELSKKVVSPLGVEEYLRVKLGVVKDRVIVSPLPRGAGTVTSLAKADGMLRIPPLSEGIGIGDQVEIELLRPRQEICNALLVVGSHDLTLDLISNWLKRKRTGYTLSSSHVGSLGGLMAIRRGEAHIAGIHLLDESTGDYNIPYLERLLSGIPVYLVNLVYRQQGLIVATGNPLQIQGLEDLRRPKLRFVNRQRGAGTRVLLDYELKQRSIPAAEIYGYEREEFTHMAVAVAVASGSADCGLGVLAAARALGLDFIPLVEERYDLCIPAAEWRHPGIEAVLQVLQDPDFLRTVAEQGGYDVRESGKVLWQP